MFNPKLDMKDLIEREPPIILNKKNKLNYAKLNMALAVLVLLLVAFYIWSILSEAHASSTVNGYSTTSCVSESVTDVASQHTILFKKRC